MGTDGAIFTIFIHVMNSSSIQPISATKRILIVDDIADNCFLLQTILEAEGYQTDVANSGYVALEKVNAAPPDLVLLDVMMPEMNGLEVAQHIRQNPALPPIPILLITGYSHLRAEDFGVKINGFIRKPIDFEALLKQIRLLLQSGDRPTPYECRSTSYQSAPHEYLML